MRARIVTARMISRFKPDVTIIAGVYNPLVGRLLIFKGRWFYFKEEGIRINPHCPVCGPLRVGT